MNTDPKNKNPIPERAPSQPEPVKPDTNTLTAHPVPESFGPVVYCANRDQTQPLLVRLAVRQLAAITGFRYAVFITEAVKRECVEVPAGLLSQTEQERLTGLLTVLDRALRSAVPGTKRLAFQLYARRSDDASPRLLALVAECDADSIQRTPAAITVMLPHEA